MVNDQIRFNSELQNENNWSMSYISQNVSVYKIAFTYIMELYYYYYYYYYSYW